MTSEEYKKDIQKKLQNLKTYINKLSNEIDKIDMSKPKEKIPDIENILMMMTGQREIIKMAINDMKEKYYLTIKQIKKIGKIVEVGGNNVKKGKKFFKPNDDLLPIFSNPNLIIYPIDKDEIESPALKEIIENKQFKQIDENTFLTWY